MTRPIRALSGVSLGVLCLTSVASAQTGLSWREVKELFQKNNPSHLAGELTVREFQANEVTASLRPNPVFTSTEDQNNFFSTNPYRPLGASQWTQSVSQLVERRGKRRLRTESARLATSISRTDFADLDRQLLFALRDAFIRVMQGKSIVELAEDNLRYYDRVIRVNRERQKAGDISRIDLQRVELQRAQVESDLINAKVGLRTAKIALLALLNEQTPVDTFDVSGVFEYKPVLLTVGEGRAAALESRPDLKSASAGVEKAKADNRLAIANGSTDPAVLLDYSRVGPNNTVGVGFSVPLRIFDRNQGEKERTAIEIGRAGKARDAVLSGIYRDVDSAFAAVESTAELLKPYREQYLPQSADVRDTVSFAYDHGGASLLEFLDAQKSYRDTQLGYRNLIAAYLSAVNQLSLAMGREVIP
ncbi:MAG: TolC family protein [Bryobacterales bacterium]|nr:TolC family protein [Bryobacterales bacterium]